MLLKKKNTLSKKKKKKQTRKQPPGVFYKKVALKNFAKFSQKHMCQSLFPVNFAKFLRTLFYRTSLDDWLFALVKAMVSGVFLRCTLSLNFELV